MNEPFAFYEKTADYVKSRAPFAPELGLILGTGLGPLAKQIENPVEIDYKDIPNFLVSTATDHAGKLIFGTLEGKKLVCMSGRFHSYEGYDFEQLAIPVRLFKLLGVKQLIVTNAAGGVNTSFHAGDLMLIRDHISVFAPNPLIGANIDELGLRFPDMSHVYDKDLQQIIRETAKENDIYLQEGIYTQLTGPSFESPAEIRMVRTLGADAVGMSTACEAVAANHMGMKILGISFISNLAAGMSTQPLSHKEVQEAADLAAPKFRALVTEVIRRIGEHEKSE